jgi:hypothetical protein
MARLGFGRLDHRSLGLRPATPSIKPLPPAPPEEQHHYTTCNCVGVGFQRADPQSVDALWQQQIFKQIASGRYFEIRY